MVPRETGWRCHEPVQGPQLCVVEAAEGARGAAEGAEGGEEAAGGGQGERGAEEEERRGGEGQATGTRIAILQYYIG